MYKQLKHMYMHVQAVKHMYMHVQVGHTIREVTFRVSDSDGGKKGESETIATTHGLLERIGRKKIFQALNMGTHFPLGVRLCV